MAFESGADAADARRLLTTARYSIIEPLPMAYGRQIERVPGVVAVASADWFGAKYQNESNAFPVFAVDPPRYLAMYPEFIIAPAQREAFAKTRTGAIAGQRLADRYGWKVGQKLPIASEIHAKADGSLELGVRPGRHLRRRGSRRAGQHRHGADQRRVLRRGAAVRARQDRAGTSSASPTPARRATISAEIDRLFANSPDETKTQPEKEFAIGFAKQIGDIGALVTRILIAVFFTILILTGNTMAQAIRERIPELAVLKTLGFSDGTVTALVLGEALLLLGARRRPRHGRRRQRCCPC